MKLERRLLVPCTKIWTPGILIFFFLKKEDGNFTLSHNFSQLPISRSRISSKNNSKNKAGKITSRGISIKLSNILVLNFLKLYISENQSKQHGQKWIQNLDYTLSGKSSKFIRKCRTSKKSLNSWKIIFQHLLPLNWCKILNKYESTLSL